MTEKIYEFIIDDYQIQDIRHALESYRYAVASVTEDDEKKKTYEGLEEAEIEHETVEDLDELLKLFTQLDNRITQNEKFYLRYCVIPETEEGDDV
ncbi:MAG TPA: hypothetical protein VIP70_08165 [Nitrososphaeraceae archaeon]